MMCGDDGEAAVLGNIRKDIEAHIALLETVRDTLLDDVLAIGEGMRAVLARGNKIMVAGNGGSEADAQHFAAELVGRYLKEREALAAIALTTETSILTAVGNDYGFEEIFSRQVAGLGRVGDLFLAISTSGNSENLVRALEVADKSGIETVALLGKSGGKMKDRADRVLIVPSDCTPHIQVAQHWIWHTWCDILDQ